MYHFNNRDEALELIAWMRNRNDYRRACGMEMDPETASATAAAARYLSQLDGISGIYEPMTVPFTVIA